MSKFLIPIFSLAFHFGLSFQALSFLNSFHFFLHFHLVPISLFFFIFLSSDPLFWFFLFFPTVITRKLWNRKTILKAHIKFIWYCYKAIVSLELINSITNWNWSVYAAQFYCVSCLFDYLKSYYEPKSRLPIPELYNQSFLPSFSFKL